MVTATPAYLTKQSGKKPGNRNPVARHMNEFNKPQTHSDRKHDYKRKPRGRRDDDRNPDNWSK